MSKFIKLSGLLLRMWIFLACSLVAAELVWLEAESPDEGEPASPYGWLAPAGDEQTDKLSGGNWLHFSPSNGDKQFRWDFNVASDGAFDIFVRRFWHHGAFMWRIDDGAWTRCEAGGALLDNVAIKEHVCANWQQLTQVELAKGRHSLQLRTIKTQTPLAIDCFCITDSVFVPRGKLRPDQRQNLSEDGWWAFEPTVDPFTSDCKLNLRYLNEELAGQSGRVSRRGDKLIRGDGQEIRFWGVGVSPSGKSLQQLRYQAKRLAALGVNAVRMHVTIAPRGEDSEITDVNEQLIDDAHRLVAAMKEQGIYTVISPLFALNLEIQSGWGVEGYGPGADVKRKAPLGLLFWNKQLQRGYRSWVGQLLTRENPYTNMTLAADPALCIFQLQNEDSNLFWTFLGNIPQAQRDALAGQFHDRLIEKYGSYDEVIKRFGGRELVKGKGGVMTSDSRRDETIALMGAWFMTSKYHGDQDARVAEQIEFLARQQYDFNKNMVSFLREQCGYTGLTNANNWRTCDDDVLLDVERWTYTPCDVIDLHSYFNGTHVNETNSHRASYSVSPGDKFISRSVLKNPSGMPLAFRSIAGAPYIMSECTWPQPNEYKAEAPLYIAAYGRLSGLDGFFWFHSGELDYDNSITKFQVNMPSIMGQFPAAALLYRSDYLREGPVVFHEDVNLEKCFTDKTPCQMPEGLRFDPNRDSYSPGDWSGEFRQLAYLRGRVTVSYENGVQSKARQDVSKLPKKALPPMQKKLEVQSATSQSGFSISDGQLTVVSDYVSAQCGFGLFGDMPLSQSCPIGCKNDYGAIFIISLDGEPLKKSRRILIQAMTRDKPYGWLDEAATIESVGGKGKLGEKTSRPARVIRSLGSRPWNVENIDAAVRLPNANFKRATVLDEYGYPKGEVEIHVADGVQTVKLPVDAMYTVVEAE